MNGTAQGECPRCGEELTVAWFTENHKVHNGIGMQTVARDQWVELDEVNCDCAEDDPYTPKEWEEIENNAAQEHAQRMNDYYSEEFDQMKDNNEIY